MSCQEETELDPQERVPEQEELQVTVPDIVSPDLPMPGLGTDSGEEEEDVAGFGELISCHATLYLPTIFPVILLPCTHLPRLTQQKRSPIWNR